MKYEFFGGKIVINTFRFFLLWVDLVRFKESVTLVFDLGWFSIGFRLRREVKISA